MLTVKENDRSTRWEGRWCYIKKKEKYLPAVVDCSGAEKKYKCEKEDAVISHKL